jgi:hypothetical protein
MHTFTISVLLLVAHAAPVAGQDAAAAIESAITRLGDREFDVRQEATDFLWGIGPPASLALKNALQDPDPEVRSRARSILERHSYGIFVETPQHEVKLINRFRYGSRVESKKAYQRLAKEGSVETLLTLLRQVSGRDLLAEFRELVLRRLEQDREVDQLLTLATRWLDEAESADHRERIQAKMCRQVPRLLASGRKALAESVLAQTATTDQGMRDWAVYLFLEGKLADAIVSVDAANELNATRMKQQVYFWRVQGNVNEASEFARRLGKDADDLLRGTLFERRDWPALAESLGEQIRADADGAGQNIEALGYAAAFCRLAGETNDFNQMVERIQSLAGAVPKLEFKCAEALLINQRVGEGIDVLRQNRKVIAFEMLCLQERYKEAFELADINDPHDDNIHLFEAIAAKAGSKSQPVTRRFQLALATARVLHRLGEQDQAIRAFEVLAKAVRHERGTAKLHDICKAEYRAGLWHRACEHAAIILDKGKYPDPIPTLFPRQSNLARVWYKFFRNSQAASNLQALQRTGALLRAGSSDPRKQIAALAADASAHAEQFEEKERASWLLAISRTCDLLDRHDLAVEHLEMASSFSSDAALRLGDVAARDEDWVTAGQWYEKARDLDVDSCLARYLHGYSLKQRGRLEQGQAQIDLALLLPLANSTARRQLASGLKERGLRQAAVEQWQLVLRSGGFLVSLEGEFRDTSVVDAAQNIGNSLTDDLLGRANYWEIMHLSCLEELLWIPSYRGYFHTPHILHKTRAQAYLREGQFELARQEIKLSRSFMPGNIELAEHLVPDLEQAGQQTAADELFEDCFKFVSNVCKQFPDSPLHHNNLAWLCARCDRQLDTALVHVRRALELAPQTPSYLDTLGEVHFRRGEYAQAVECARECLALEPNSEFFQKQLERFQRAQDPN